MRTLNAPGPRPRSDGTIGRPGALPRPGGEGNGAAGDAVIAEFPVAARAATATPVPDVEQNPPSPRPPILARQEASRRAGLLRDLQTALTAQGVSSVLARHHRLVLRGGGRTRCEPSGPTDPQLHIFTPDGTDIATADGSTYHFASGSAHPAGDPARAALRATGRDGI